MKVLYFTSTGNSLYVARQFSDEPMSIIALNRSGIYDIEDDEAIGIIIPDHVCDIPEPVRQYLKRAKLGAPYKFAIITYGSEYAAAPERLLELQNVDYLGTLLMVDNYFPVFNQGQQIQDVNSKKIPYHLNQIVSDIENRIRFLRLSEKSKKLSAINGVSYICPKYMSYIRISVSTTTNVLSVGFVPRYVRWITSHTIRGL